MFICNLDACFPEFPPHYFRVVLSNTDPSPGGCCLVQDCVTDREAERQIELCLDSKQTLCTENTENTGAEVREHFCLYFPCRLLTVDMPPHGSVCVCAFIVVNGLITRS